MRNMVGREQSGLGKGEALAQDENQKNHHEEEDLCHHKFKRWIKKMMKIRKMLVKEERERRRSVLE